MARATTNRQKDQGELPTGIRIEASRSDAPDSIDAWAEEAGRISGIFTRISASARKTGKDADPAEVIEAIGRADENGLTFIHSFVHSPDAQIPDGALAILAQENVLDPAWLKTEGFEGLINTSSEIWRALARRAARDAKIAGEHLSPPLFHLFEHALGIVDVLEKIPEARAAWRGGNRNASEIVIEAGGMAEAWARFSGWAEQANASDVAWLAENAPRSQIAGVVASTSPLAATTDGIFALAATEQLSRIATNPHLTDEGRKTLVTIYMTRYSGTADSVRDFPEVFQAHGGNFDSHKTALRVLVETPRHGEPGKNRTFNMLWAARTRTAAEDPHMREILIAENSAWLDPALLWTLQGNAWERVASRMAAAPTTEIRKMLEDRLEHCQAWQMEGVSREFLASLAGHEREGIRNAARQLLLKTRQGERSPRPVKGPPRPKRAL